MEHNVAMQLFWWAFLGYSLSCLLYIVFLVFEKRLISTLATLVMTLSFVLLTAALIVRSIIVQHLPLTNMFEYISLFAWFAAIFYFLALKMYKLQIIGAFFSIIIFMLMVSGSLLPKRMDMQLVPALQSYWLQIHVSLAALGEAAFTTAFVANIMFFLKKFLPQKSSFAHRLPQLATLDRISYKSIKVGYPLFTVGALFAGAIWAEQAWGRFWSWDPKEVGSLVVWLVYTAYLHARYVKGWQGTRAAVLSAIGFICTLLTFFANMILGGLHSYG